MSQAAARDPIREFVQSAAVHIRKTELAYSWMILLSVLLFSTVLFVLLDHWVWEINQPVRLLLWIALVLWSLWWFIRRVLPPMRYQIHPEYAARQFELQDPRSKDSLISWIQLNQSANTAPKSVLNFVGRYAFGFLRNSDATQVADSANLIRLTAAFFGCLLCTLIYFSASPKSGFTSAARLLMPWANIAPATRVQFDHITPGATTIMQGSSIPISVTVKGLYKSEKVYLRYDLSDGQVRGETVAMNEEIQGISYKLEFGKDLGGLHQPLTYWIHAGDAVAGPFDVGIQIVPLVAIDRIELNFPPYTNLKPRTIHQQGQFEAPEGTLTKFHAIANQEMQSARIEFDPVLQNKLFLGAREYLEMTVDKTQLDASWTATIDRKNAIEKKITTYRIHAVNNLKESNRDPIVYQIKIIPDLPPEIEFTGSSNSTVDVPIDQGILLEMNARDPDYGLTSIEIQGATENKLNPEEPKILFRESLFVADDDQPRTKNTQFTFLPQNHALKVGDEIDLIASASDNYHNPISQKMQPQWAFSQPLRIRIVDTSAPPENPQNANEPSTLKNEAEIAENQNPQPKSRIDWDKYRKQQDQNPSRSSSNSNQKDPTPNNQKQNDEASTPKSGQGGSEGADGQSGSKQAEPDAQSSSSNASGSTNSQGNPAPENLNGTPTPSSNPNSDQSPNNNKPSSTAPKQDQDALEKIQQFMKEQQREGANGQQSNGSQSNSASSNSSSTNLESKGSNDPGNGNPEPNKPQNDNPNNQPPDPADASQNPSSADPSTMNQPNADKSAPGKSVADKSGADKSGADKNTNGGQTRENAGSKQTTGNKTGNKNSPDKLGSDKEQSAPDKANDQQNPTGSDPSSKTGPGKQTNSQSAADKSAGESSGTGKPTPENNPKGQSGSDQEGNNQRSNPKTNPEKANSATSGTDKMTAEESGTDQAGDNPNGDMPNGSNQQGSGKQNGDKQGAGNPSGNEPSGEQQSGDKSGGDKSGGDKSGGDKSGGDKSGGDKSGGDKPGGDKSGGDKSGGDKSGGDKSGGDKSGGDKSGGDKSGGDKSGGDKSGGDKSGGDKSGSNSGSDPSGSGRQPGQKTGAKETGPESNKNPQEGPNSKGPKGTPNQEQGDGKGSGDQEGGKQGSPNASTPNSAGSGLNNTGKTPQSSGQLMGGRPSQSAEFGADQSNQEYARKAGDLLLDYIDRQRDQPDPELLKRLNWSNDDFRKFADRWAQAKEQAKFDPSKRAELDEALRNLGLAGTGQKINRLKDRNDGLRGMQEEGGRLRPPESLREQFEAFRKAAGKLGK